MCGIAALYSKKAIDHHQIKKMTDIIEYRGPDGDGHQALFDGHLWLGHRRLAIVDLSEKGHQPMSVAEGRFWITFNGEIYNYLEIRHELEGLGYQFLSHTDTEVILAAYMQWGEQCLQRFNGMWAFVLVDTQERTLFAARDRFGVKPLYFAHDDRSLAFASEIKQLRAVGLGTGRADREEVAKFLIYGDVNMDRKTFFEGILQVMPSEALLWNIDEDFSNIRIWKYYEPPINESMTEGGSLDDYQKKFRALLEDAVRLRLRSDVPVGSCLSGGLDSSSIVLTVNRILKEQAVTGSQKTFTSCFSDPRFDEWQYAEQVIEATEANGHRVFPKMEDLFSELERLVWHQEEPFRSTSIYAQWNVMRLVREQGVTVLLDGQGADEVMAGYHTYLPFYLSNLVKAGRLADAMRSVDEMKQTGVLSATESIGRVVLKTLNRSFGLQSLRRTPMKVLLKKEFQGIKRKRLATSFQEMLHQDLFGSLQSLLRHEDRNSMAFSVEARTPFLDYRIVELFLAMPGQFKMRQGWTKPFLRESMAGVMPEPVRLRADKKGFVTPEVVWYQQNFETIKEILLSEQSPIRLWVDQSLLKKWLSAPDNIRSAYIWRLLSVHFWMVRFELK